MSRPEPKCYPGDAPRIIVTPEFIEAKNLTLNRTQKDLSDRLAAIRDDDMLGFRTGVLLEFADGPTLRPFLKEEYQTDEYISAHVIETDNLEDAAQDFLDYMVFAWMKATDERGISASRSIDKLGEWLWILGREDLYEVIHDDGLYSPYGAPALIKVCESLGIEVPDDVRSFARVPCSR